MADTKANIILDASKLDLFETCPQRYNLRHNMNKSLPIIHKAKALDIGSLAHGGLATYYRLLGEQKEYEERSQACLMKIREMSVDPEQSNAEPDDVNNLLHTIEENLDYWRAEDENCLEILAVEQPFAYVLYEDEFVRFIISGQIDLLVNYRGIGGNSSYERLPIDHKTFSRDSITLRKSNQFINYANAVSSNFLHVNRIGLHTSKMPADMKFKRLPLSYDPIYINDWKQNLTKMLLQEYLPCVADNYWPEKPTSCNKFNRLCEYFAICDSSGEEAKMFKLESDYVTVPEWDVTKGLTSEVG